MRDPVETGVKPTLEDLFAVKRAERPDESFWREFEHGLRQKQLAAIVLPRPWWHAPSLWARKMAPLGGFAAAAAALALAFVSLRSPVEFQGDRPAGQAFDRSVAAVSKSESDPGLGAVPGDTVGTISDTSVSPAPDLGSAEPVLLASTENPGESGPLASTEAALSAPPAGGLVNVEAKLVSEGFGPATGLAIEDFSVVPAVVLVETPESEAAPAETLVIEAPAVLKSRHDRLLAKALEDTDAPGAEERSLAQVRERVVHRLADGEELYASITRVGVSGDRLSLKF